MIPIQGTMLAAVLGDRRNLRRSVGPVVAGGLSAIAIGWLLGDIVVGPVTAQTNAQVTARVKLRLVDLLAAPATGAVGSIALVRRDISDTLPGVASTISLVPPLTVVGLTLQTRQFSRAEGTPPLRQRCGRHPGCRHQRHGAVRRAFTDSPTRNGGESGAESAQCRPRDRCPGADRRRVTDLDVGDDRASHVQ
jgi:hypothetical protein